MRFADILGLALSALRQQKGRTVLTMSGVIIGTFALVVIVALGQGFQDAISKQFNKGNQLRQVMVNPGYGAKDADRSADEVTVPGEMSDDKRRRIRKTLLSRRGMGNPQQKRTVQLTADRVAAVRAIPGVETVTPMIQDRYQISAGADKTAEVISFGSAADNERFINRTVAGKFLSSDDGREVVLHEYLLYRWGITGDKQVGDIIGKTVTLEFRPGAPGGGGLGIAGDFLDLNPEERKTLEAMLKRLKDNPADLLNALAALKLTPQETAILAKVGKRLGGGKDRSGPPEDVHREEFTVVGVIREFMEDDDVNIFEAGMSLQADVFLPIKTAERLFNLSAANRGNGFPSLIVTTDSEDSSKEVTKKIRGMGLIAISMGSLVERVQTALTIITALVAFLGAVALFVAALGIINTMIMSVLERTREIGVMKAVGARDWHVQLLFFTESAMIGTIGGGLGALLGWLAGFPGDALGRSLIEQNTHTPFKGTLFVYPLWLLGGAVGFALVVSILAAVFPARRAARVNPITALRHE